MGYPMHKYPDTLKGVYLLTALHAYGLDVKATMKAIRDSGLIVSEQDLQMMVDILSEVDTSLEELRDGLMGYENG